MSEKHTEVFEVQRVSETPAKTETETVKKTAQVKKTPKFQKVTAPVTGKPETPIPASTEASNPEPIAGV